MSEDDYNGTPRNMPIGTYIDANEHLSILRHAAQSKPPSGMLKVTNLYVDPATGRLVVEYESTPAP